MSFSSQVRDSVLVACGRHCSICHRFCGIKIELHHIKLESAGGPDSFDNCIPLCFDCHADMRSYDHKHPKGAKYSENELKQHRDNWYSKVKDNSAILTLPQHVELDRTTFQRIKSLLPWDQSVLFCREYDFGNGPFSRDIIKPLKEFINLEVNPSFEFIDADLEGAHADLRQAIQLFVDTLPNKVFRAGPQMYSVPEEWENEQPERYISAIRDLHDAGKAIGDTYDILVKLGRRKLAAE